MNDVVLAACTQTLRSYLESHGGAPELPLVAAIPVSLRGWEDAESYGNRISALLVHLPVRMNITIFSYAGSVDFGIVACERAVPHVSDIALGFGAAVGRLLKIALEKTGESPAVTDDEAGPSDPASKSADGD